MAFIKYKPSSLFTGNEMLETGVVLVATEEGEIADILPTPDAGDDIQELNGILSPGFINAHCHLELSHLKGIIPEDTGLVDFVSAIVSQRHFPQEVILSGIEKGEAEMLQNGIVAVGDICNNDSTFTQKQQYNLAYYNFIETSGWLPAGAASRFAYSADLFRRFSENFTDTAIVPHAPYSVSANLWALIQPFFSGKTITIHNQETAFEDLFFTEGTGDFLRMYGNMKIDNSFFVPTGTSSLQSYLHQLQTAKNLLLVHNTFTSETDILFTKNLAPDAFWCLCANANQYIENAMPPIEKLRNHQCNIVVGTDSLASNHSLSILDEMKTIQRHFPAIAVAEMLQWATSNGAKALGMDDVLGSFEKGKKPGILLIQGAENSLVNATVKRLL